MRVTPRGEVSTLAWDILAGWQAPVLTLYSATFAGSAMGPERLVNHLPGAQGQAHALLTDANFYIVEDQSAELARRVAAFARTAN